MPRLSAEARSAAAWREGGKHPKPPQSFSPEERVVWHQIVDCRPVDYFAPGSLHLLEQFCLAVTAARKVAVVLRERPGNAEAAKIYLSYASQCASHATKLRIAVSSVERAESGKLTEKNTALPKGRKEKAGVLFGGNVLTF